MILAHIFLPAMLIVICKSQQMSSHFPDHYGNDVHPDVFGLGGGGSVGGGGTGIRSSLGDLTSASSSTSPQYNNNNSNELLDRYRQFIANSLIKLSDSCRVFDFLQKIKNDMENEGAGKCCLFNQITYNVTVSIDAMTNAQSKFI